ncbi:MAG: hypothetical protein K0R10_453 [Alphaproteobacteria bacterium]|nr:hypothetical protein [Alphaproteobacteria bacterium]
MSLPDRALLNLFSDLQSAEAVSAALASEAGQKWLLTPLSKDVPDSALSYMADGMFKSTWRDPHKEYMALALAALEQAEPDAGKRVALLTARNGLGQSVIHKSLEYGGSREAFEPVLDALYKWAGTENADRIMKDILAEPLGQIDKGISFDLQSVRSIFPHTSREFAKVDALTTDSYHPVPSAALREMLNDIPGKAFFRLLEIQLKGGEATPQQKADDVFALLSVKNAAGNTPMHREWVVSDLLGTPTSANQFTDRLSPLLSAFDRLLGTDVALELTKKLLLQENAKGQLPLDIFQYPKLPTRDLIIDKMLQTLRAEMGSEAARHSDANKRNRDLDFRKRSGRRSPFAPPRRFRGRGGRSSWCRSGRW